MIALVVGLLLVRVVLAALGCAFGCVQAVAGLALELAYWAGRGLWWLLEHAARRVIRRRGLRGVAERGSHDSPRAATAWMHALASRAARRRRTLDQHAVLAGVRAART